MKKLEYTCDGCEATASVASPHNAFPESPEGWAQIHAQTPLTIPGETPEGFEGMLSSVEGRAPPKMVKAFHGMVDGMRRATARPVEVHLDLCPECQDSPLFELLREKALAQMPAASTFGMPALRPPQ
jgi:hypothetical protein